MKLTGKSNLRTLEVAPGKWIAFSYGTPIVFCDGRDVWKSPNLWGPTTGRHLNSLPGEPMESREAFEAKLREVF